MLSLERSAFPSSHEVPAASSARFPRMDQDTTDTLDRAMYEPCSKLDAIGAQEISICINPNSTGIKRKRATEIPPTASEFNNTQDTEASRASRGLNIAGDTKLLIAMVGLPARGKSYVTKKLSRYLSWLQYNTEIFNVGNRRRKLVGRPMSPPAAGVFPTSPCSLLPDLPDQLPIKHTAGFFDPENSQAIRLREQVAMETLDESLDYLLDDGNSVAIFDATNSTIDRRKLIMQNVRNRAGSKVRVLFLEIKCFDENLLHSNMSLKISGPDYRNQDPVLALHDFKKRVEMYEKKYVTIGQDEENQGVAYCQMIDVGRKFITHKIEGSLMSQVAGYLQRFNLAGRLVCLTRHPDTQDDSSSDSGQIDETQTDTKYASTLARFIKTERKAWHERQEALSSNIGSRLEKIEALLRENTNDSSKKFHVWTAMARNSVKTTRFFDPTQYKIHHMGILNELKLEGLSERPPKRSKAEDSPKIQMGEAGEQYHNTTGEGYFDVTGHLQSVILELERVTGHVLLISGLGAIRSLLAYCKGIHYHEIANSDIPFGRLYMFEPRSYGVEYREYTYCSERDWFYQTR